MDSRWRLCMRRVLAGLLVAALVSFPCALAGADPVPVAPSAELNARIDAYLAEEREALDLPGIELAVVRDGRVEHLTALGTSGNHDQPLTPQTPVLLASLSKSLTAVAVMQLVESGKLALDAPVVRYLPWFTTRDRALSAKITVAQLLHQTSGLPEHDRSETKLLTDNSPAALENGVRAMSQIDLLYPPGTRWTYSNANYQILGLLVQTTSGQPFAQYMTEHVFEPAGMRHSYAEKAPAVAAGASAAYYRWYGLWYRVTPSIAEPPGLAPAAMMWSSAEDLAQHLILNMNQGSVGGRSVLAPSAVAEMHRPAAEVNVANSYTMGWYMRPAWEQSSTKMFGENYQLPFVWEHGGSWNTTSTYLGFIPSQQLGIVVLINGNNPPAESALGNIHTNIWHLLAGTPTEPATPNEPLLLRYGSVLALAIVALLTVSLAWSVRELKRRRQMAVPVSPRRRWLSIALPLLVDVAVLCFVWIYLPRHFVTTVPTMVRDSPDIGLVIILTTLLATVWGSARTVLLLKTRRQ